MKPIRSEGDLDDLARAAQALAVIAAWRELGLLAALADGPVALEALPAHPRGLATTAPLMAHLGLIRGDGVRYELTEPARALLAGGLMPGQRDFGFFRDLSRTAEAIADGGPVRGDDGRPKRTVGGTRPGDRQATAAFLQMLYDSAADPARQVLEWTAPRLAPDAAVLDLGGGHGRYARVFADAGHPTTLLDQPMVIELARERHGEALRYLEGDFLDGAPLGGPYGAALLSNIVHGQSPEENRRLVARLHEALEPGGLLVIKDMFLDDLGDNPEPAVFFGLTMLFFTEGGRSYGLREVDAWCRGAGFQPVERAVLGRFTLAFARRR